VPLTHQAAGEDDVKCERLAIPEVVLVEPRMARDARGFFSETYVERELEAFGIRAHFVQENHSLSVARATVRGLHFQIHPHAQDKLVRVVRGAIFDVAVDIRIGSPTLGKHVAAILSAENRLQVWIPKGFAHGFCTLEAGTEVLYKVSDYFDRTLDRGLRWNDPDLLVQWPIAASDVVLSPKDSGLPRFAQLAPHFRYGADAPAPRRAGLAS
jgi:dTDP-4-dehydrorhamnose 3,5-epimerase